MNDRKLQLVYGALLHDVGKVVQRGISERDKHSVHGKRFLEEALNGRDDIDDQTLNSIYDQVAYHHADALKAATVSADSLAYITYFADNISAGMDRKKEEEGYDFDPDVKLRRIFNILNGHHDDNLVDHEDYNTIQERIKKGLLALSFNEEGIGSLLNLLEATCSTVPSSTDTNALVDVSLFDHSKTTAAIVACLYDWLIAENITDYCKTLFDSASSREYYEKPIFLLWSCDLSGIQNFIYQISGSQALKQLRARSFYLDMLLEDIADELLERLDLTRCNLLYTGGGHAYVLLSNTKDVHDKLNEFCSELKTWLLEQFRTDLYCASAYVECSADDLANGNMVNGDRASKDTNQFGELFKELTEKLSAVKANRYTAEEIKKLNFEQLSDIDHTRECSECHRSDLTGNFKDGRCSLCNSFVEISPKLIKDGADVLVVSNQEIPNEINLNLPFEKYLNVYTVGDYFKQQPSVVRVYTKNRWDTGIALATHLWMGDYTAPQYEEGMSYYASHGVTLDSTGERNLGIERLGVLRADVDNLGSIFSNGFSADKASISRSATLSRVLSYFFKHEINKILDEKKYQVQIIYAGGDDTFIVGNWSDVIYAARDIRNALDAFTGNGVLTISAGLGMYQSKFPIARMASEVGELEDAAKKQPEKNAVTLWMDDFVFSWNEFNSDVCTKFCEIKNTFKDEAFIDIDKGKSFIYQILSLLSEAESDLKNNPEKNPIAIPRLAYLLARTFENGDDKSNELCEKFFRWANTANERKSFKAALEWYVYSIRERG